VVKEAAEAADLVSDPRLEISKKTKIVSTGKNNRALILGALPVDSEHRQKIQALEDFKVSRDLMSRYTLKYLHHPKEGLIGTPGVPNFGMVYPTWRPCPSYTKDESGGSGGTQQGRLTASNPGVTTNPPSMKACMTSRFIPGVVLAGDLSQIELRMMALLSGDPVMMKEYREGTDRHLATGLLILKQLERQLISTDQDEAYEMSLEWLMGLTIHTLKSYPGIAPWRQLGKTVNFLKAYWGGARALQATARRDNKIELDLQFCKSIIAADARKYPVFTAWQEERFQEAVKRKCLELPLIGDRRTFAGSPRAIRESYLANIASFDIQTPSARVCQSAQRSIGDDLVDQGLRTLIIENVYDNVVTDGPAGEEDAVRALFAKHLPCPPYYELLQYHIGRTLPLDYEVEVLARTQ
jgi:hypothetical protein